MYQDDEYIPSFNIHYVNGFVPPILATFEVKRRIEAEEQADATLKALREAAAITGDLSAVMAHKRSKAQGLTKGSE